MAPWHVHTLREMVKASQEVPLAVHLMNDKQWWPEGTAGVLSSREKAVQLAEFQKQFALY